jgi:hypothetical protein
MTEPQPQPGWYTVPGGVQWWDGAAWTGEIQAVQPAATPATVSYVPVQTNHVFHLILTILTCGLWGLFVWLPMTIINQLRKNKVVTRPY